MVLETAINNLERNSLKLDIPSGKLNITIEYNRNLSLSIRNPQLDVLSLATSHQVAQLYGDPHDLWRRFGWKKFRHKSALTFFRSHVVSKFKIDIFFPGKVQLKLNIYIYIGYIDFQVCGKSQRHEGFRFFHAIGEMYNFPRLDLRPIFSNRTQHPPFGFMESAGKATLSSGASQWLGGGSPSIEAWCCFHCLSDISIFFIFHLYDIWMYQNLWQNYGNKMNRFL